MNEKPHEEHAGCKCGGVCRITGACGKHALKGEVEKEEMVVEEVVVVADKFSWAAVEPPASFKDAAQGEGLQLSRS